METPFLISVQEARNFVRQHAHRLVPLGLPIEKSLGHILAEDVSAPYSIPGFVQSSVDGYAIRFSDWEKGYPLKIAGESAAGNAIGYSLGPGEAYRVFTGASLPSGADTMVMQEHVEVLAGNSIGIKNAELKLGNQVRAIGSEIKAGTLARKKGTHLTPSSLAFLANIGFASLPVYPHPRISMILTGNELQKPGTRPEPGKVFESNSYSIRAALENLHIPGLKIHYSVDDLDILVNTIEKCKEDSDLLLVTGGVSVGDYDFTPKALEKTGFEFIFYKIKQRPGKPLLFAKNQDILAFGLPGNPGSVLTCFYQYVLPAIAIMTGREDILVSKKARIGTDFRKIKGLTFFTRGIYKDQELMPLSGQESYKMGTYAEANCLIEMEEDMELIAKGTEMTIWLIN